MFTDQMSSKDGFLATSQWIRRLDKVSEFPLHQLLNKAVDFQSRPAFRKIAEYDSVVRQNFTNKFNF